MSKIKAIIKRPDEMYVPFDLDYWKKWIEI